ncbi:YkvA family protein [Streptomyces sp. ITFR-16]|uniref:YkvA family protein n=1 Tax=Streptomyces sp. ITFR-16 TaxID=3075198 RepID=UPI00288A79B5|nr:YkvA family protein [Streptomyces sp. ITFR-16]WNI20730.1 YkvA family protein [Streptomyces sp. ITFR-16]
MDTTTWIIVIAVLVLLTAGVACVLVVRVFRARKLLVDAGIPLHNKALVWAAVLYTVSPVDLLPDPIYLDDIGFLLMALHSLHAAARAAGIGTGGGEGRPLEKAEPTGRSVP